ncbi:MAG: DUF2628 domain-containing protein [Nanoarchaeota archaeon]|nr:DUF2628 domain-containing protein [Nanoarchaeota archaeon]
MGECLGCKKKLGVFEGYTDSDGEYCKNCFPKRKSILKLKEITEKEEKKRIEKKLKEEERNDKLGKRIYKQKASGYIEEVGIGFNGWAFFFGPLWFLVKGMIGMMLLVFIGNLLIASFFGWIGSILFCIIIGATANRTHEDHLIKKGYSILKPKRK